LRSAAMSLRANWRRCSTVNGSCPVQPVSSGGVLRSGEDRGDQVFGLAFATGGGTLRASERLAERRQLVLDGGLCSHLVGDTHGRASK
jgi:hypothetical protein